MKEGYRGARKCGKMCAENAESRAQQKKTQTRIAPKRKLYIALRERRRCVNRNESEEENTRHHQPASSWLRNSQASFSVPRKHSTRDSKGTLVSGSDPLVLSPSWFLTGTACSSEDITECTTYFVFSWATYASPSKQLLSFSFFPVGGTFPWIRAQYFLLPVHHYTTPPSPGDHGFFHMLKKVAAQQHWKKRGFGSKHNTNGEREENRETLPSAPAARASCLHPPKHRGWAMCSAGQATSTSPEWGHGHCWGVGLCLPAYPVLCRIRSAGQNPSLTNSPVRLKMLLKVMEGCQACRHS